MIPVPFRLLVFVASLLVPKAKRSEWRHEWEAELWHRAETGASREELFRRSTGVFRDALWFSENERRKHGFDPFRKPLRVEACFLALALLAGVFGHAFSAPRRPYADAGRLVVMERNLAFTAAVNPQVSLKLINLARDQKIFSDLAPYRILRLPMLGVRTSRTFFNVLGSKPLLGRTFQADDPDDAIVISHEVWRNQFRSDPAVIGKREMLGKYEFTVIGVMPRDFWFLTSRLQFFAPMQWETRPMGAVARLLPGKTVAETEAVFRTTARTVDPKWFADSLRLVPLLEDTRPQNILFSLEVALLAVVLAVGFLIVKGIGGARYRAFLGARIFMTLMGLSFLRMSLSTRSTGEPISYSLFTFWIFLLICCAAAVLLVIDHRQRCPVCLGRLKKPVAIGSWSSQILDQPATEYLCPAGHGTLYVAETGNAPDHWTHLDESWQDLFAHIEE